MESGMTTRRNFLSVLGGGMILAAGASTLWATTRDPAKARRPWEVAGAAQDDPRRKALSFAILAPNPHNRQPWLVDLSADDVITLFCDPLRRLPETDPFDRQITIGLGCFLELLAQAAGEDGYRADIALFPDGEPQTRLDSRAVARIRLVKDDATRPDPLFAQVLARRSNKEAYDTTRMVPQTVLVAIAAVAGGLTTGFSNDPDKVAGIRQAAWDAMYTELSTQRTAKESVDLMRIGRAEIEANPDGIDLSGAFIETLALAGLVSREAMLDPQSSAFQQQIPILKEPFDTAMAFLWLATPGNTRADQIAAGRGHIRMNLKATELGLSMHPLSQSLQEFPEMRPHYQAMREKLGIAAGETLQMLVRLGYGPQTAAAPRWPYETRIRSA